MNENIKEFIKKLAADEELQAKLAAAKDPDEAYAVASSAQDGFSKEEIMEVMTELRNSVDADPELSDEDLLHVAGGGNWSTTTCIGVGTGIISGGALASFAAAT